MVDIIETRERKDPIKAQKDICTLQCRQTVHGRYIALDKFDISNLGINSGLTSFLQHSVTNIESNHTTGSYQFLGLDSNLSCTTARIQHGLAVFQMASCHKRLEVSFMPFIQSIIASTKVVVDILRLRWSVIPLGIFPGYSCYFGAQVVQAFGGRHWGERDLQIEISRR